MIPHHIRSSCYLIFNLTKRDVKFRYLGSLLGSYWNIIHPLVMISIYTVVFSRVMHSRLGDNAKPYSYSIYLCSALLAWNLFSDVVNRGTTTLLDNAGFIKKLSFPPWILYGATLGSALFNFFVAFGIFSVALFIVSDVHVGFYLFYWLIVVLFGIFGSGVGIGLGCLNVFVRDFQQLTSMIFNLWFWFTPIIYLYDTLPEIARKLLLFNPAYPFITALHDLIYFSRFPEPRIFLLMTIWSAIGLAFGAFIYRKTILQVRDCL